MARLHWIHLATTAGLTAALLGCPVEDGPEGEDPVYEITEPAGWAMIPGTGLLAEDQLKAWTDTDHPMSGPVANAGGCSLEEAAHDPWDGPATSLRSATYNALGHEQSHENDVDADGVTDYWRQCEFDGEGRPVLCTEGQGGQNSGTTLTWEYDVDGRLILETSNWAQEGDHGTYRAWDYNADGHLLEEVFHSNIDDGWATTTETYTWNADGFVTHIRQRGETELDGVVRDDRIYLHGEDGVPTRHDLDEGDDGVLDRVSGYTFDGPDRLVEDWLDHDADGQVDTRHVFSDFDGDRPQHADVSVNAGATEGTISLAWDTAGHVVDYLVTGVPATNGSAAHQVFEYDDDGLLTYRCQDQTQGTCGQHEEWFTYESGRLVLEEEEITSGSQVIYEWTCT